MTVLTDYNSIKTHTFIKIELDSETWLFSDANTAYTFDGNEYIGAGQLISLTSTQSELRVSSSSVTINISGIPNSEISNVLNSGVKGQSVKIYRGFFDVNTGDWIALDVNPLLRYRGFINNFSISETWDNVSRTADNIIHLECASSIDQLQYKITGRATNPSSENKFFANDNSMDRVPNLENATFNFGAP